jgi:hypothetical protein
MRGVQTDAPPSIGSIENDARGSAGSPQPKRAADALARVPCSRSRDVVNDVNVGARTPAMPWL